MKSFSQFLTLVSAGALLTSCLATSSNEELSVGPWRGEFVVSNYRVPFNFVVEDDTTALAKVYLVNGEERALLDSVYYKADSIVIPVEIYDALLIGKIQGDSLKGFFRKNQVAKKGIPFYAKHNQEFRFQPREGASNISSSVKGKWSVTLTNEKDGEESARYTVGLFEQKGNDVTGTILTTTGDYRYLQGTLEGNQLKLSAFSGSNPSLIKAELIDSVHLMGEFLSPGGKVILEAIKNDTAELPDPYTLTFLKPGFDRLSFSFPDLNGKPVSLTDEKYKGKVVVLTVLGSWCPNCVDEAAFLAPWYKQNKNRGVEIVGLSFERKDDLQFAKARLNTFIKRFDIQYDILFGGIADKKIVAQKLPELNTFLSYPTTIFIDREGKVRKVHTGYNGPATGRYYEEYIREFNDDVNALLNEPQKKTEAL